MSIGSWWNVITVERDGRRRSHRSGRYLKSTLSAVTVQVRIRDGRKSVRYWPVYGQERGIRQSFPSAQKPPPPLDTAGIRLFRPKNQKQSPIDMTGSVVHEWIIVTNSPGSRLHGNRANPQKQTLKILENGTKHVVKWSYTRLHCSVFIRFDCIIYLFIPVRDYGN